MFSDSGHRYQNSPAGCTIPLFPAKLDVHTNSIVIVEGIFDMLNCYDKGLKNVVCTFGTGMLMKDVADKLMQYKIMGITKVYILYDGDEAGRSAATKLKPLIEAADLLCEILEVEEGEDPGDFNQETVDMLIKYIQNNENSSNRQSTQ